MGTALIMTDKDLISTFLHPGDRIRIGRNRACELVISCPNLSGFHCAVEVNKTSGPNPFDGSGPPTKCTVLDLSSNGTWLIKGEDDVAEPKKMKKGVTVDFCPGDCIMLLAPQHKLSLQHRFVLQHSSATKGGAGSAEFVLVQLSREGGDSSTLIAEKLPKRKPCSDSKVDSKSDDLGDRMAAKDGSSVRKRKPADRELATLNLKKPRLEAASDTDINVTEVDVAGDEEVCGSKMLKSPKAVDEEVPSRMSKLEKVVNLEENLIPKLTSAIPIPSLAREVSKERCPTCLKLLPIVELPTHCAICQRTADNKTSCEDSASHGEEDESRGSRDGTATPPEMESIVLGAPSLPALPTEISVEQCPCCLKLFPVLELMAHAEVCMHESSVDIDGMRVDVTVSKPSISRESEAERVVSGPVVASTHSSLAPPSMPSEVSMEKCPSCLKLFPLCELVEHCELCRIRIETVREEVRAPRPMDADTSSRYNLESCTDFATAMRLSNGTSSAVGKEREKLPSSVHSQVGAAACGPGGELEQCLYCLQDFPVSELIHHVESCPARDRSKVS